MRGDQAGLASDGLDDGDVVPLREGEQFCFGERVVHTAAREDQRLARTEQRRDGGGQLAAIRASAHDRMVARFEELDRHVERQGLDVLRQTDECRAAVGRVEHRVDRQWQRGQHLVGHGDAVPEP